MKSLGGIPATQPVLVTDNDSLNAALLAERQEVAKFRSSRNVARAHDLFILLNRRVRPAFQCELATGLHLVWHR
jgi:hypothetical protein